MKKYIAVFLRNNVYHRAEFESEAPRDEVIAAATRYGTAIGFGFLYLED